MTKGKNKFMLNVLVYLCVCIDGIVSAAPLTAEDMYLDPSLVPANYYDYNVYSANYTAYFSNVQKLQVLPPLQETGNDYFFAPTVDYTGDITGTDGSITFNRPGPYYVLATYTNNSTELFDFGIGGFRLLPKEISTASLRYLPKPNGGEITIIDPELANPPWNLTGNPTIKNNLEWDAVTAYLLTLSNKHVELLGHGDPGAFYYKGVKVLDNNTQATKDWLNSMKGHINNLTFISCRVGQGDIGYSFLKSIAGTLGASAGYTEAIGDVPSSGEWFINDNGKLIVIPEPATLLLMGLGLLAIARRKNR